MRGTRPTLSKLTIFITLILFYIYFFPTMMHYHYQLLLLRLNFSKQNHRQKWLLNRAGPGQICKKRVSQVSTSTLPQRASSLLSEFSVFVVIRQPTCQPTNLPSAIISSSMFNEDCWRENIKSWFYLIHWVVCAVCMFPVPCLIVYD